MGAYRKRVTGEHVADAYAVAAFPTEPYGEDDPDRLLLGTGTVGWVSLLPSALDIPPGAQILRANLDFVSYLPDNMREGDQIVVKILRVTGQYSETTFSYKELEDTEKANGNWPLEVLSEQTFTLPLTLSDPTNGP